MTLGLVRGHTRVIVPAALAGSIHNVLKRHNISGLVEPDRYHVTLLYLGDQARGDAERFAEQLALISPPDAFEAYLDTVDVFGARKNILALRVGPRSTFGALHNQHKKLADDLGLITEHDEWSYNAHITLAIQTAPVTDEELAVAKKAARDISPRRFMVNGFDIFYKNIAANDGPSKPARHYPLAVPAAA